jgi:hypothetical protein
MFQPRCAVHSVYSKPCGLAVTQAASCQVSSCNSESHWLLELGPPLSENHRESGRQAHLSHHILFLFLKSRYLLLPGCLHDSCARRT